MGFNAFAGCVTLTKIEIPSSVTEIDDEAFFECPELTIIKISPCVNKISEVAFFGCDNLKILCKTESYAEQYALQNNILCKYY